MDDDLIEENLFWHRDRLCEDTGIRLENSEQIRSVLNLTPKIAVLFRDRQEIFNFPSFRFPMSGRRGHQEPPDDSRRLDDIEPVFPRPRR